MTHLEKMFSAMNFLFPVDVDDNALTRCVLGDAMHEANNRDHDFTWSDVIDVLREWELHTPPQLYYIHEGAELWDNFRPLCIDYMEACGDEVSYDLLRGKGEAIYTMVLGIYQMLCGDLADGLEFVGEIDKAI